MQYSPKLKTAMEEIKAILKKHDIAGFVAIHDPKGFIEYLNYINPSYSCASLEGDAFVAKLKVAELPGGRKQAQKLAEDTYNMITLLADVITMSAGQYMEFHKMLKHHWSGEEGEGRHTSHNHQNN